MVDSSSLTEESIIFDGSNQLHIDLKNAIVAVYNSLNPSYNYADEVAAAIAEDEARALAESSSGYSGISGT